MRFWNHYRMAKLMFRQMAENGIQANEAFFILGNLGPDLYFSYLYRQHTRARSGAHLERQLNCLYAVGAAESAAKFSYHLGVMSHYVCDFLCYPHTSAFKGSTREHILHEKRQTVYSDMLPFNSQEIKGLDLAKFIKTLDRQISRRDQALDRNACNDYPEIPVAMYVATWAAAVAWIYAVQTPKCHCVETPSLMRRTKSRTIDTIVGTLST